MSAMPWWWLAVSACGRVGFDPFEPGPASVTIVEPGRTDHFPGTGANHLHNVVVRADRTVVAAGHFDPDIDLGFGTRVTTGVNDLFVTGRGADGAPLWRYTPPGSGEDQSIGLAADDSGNVYLTGSFSGTFTPMSTTFTAVAGTDGFVMSLTPNGAPRWVRVFGGIGDDYGLGVAVSNGTVCIAGQFSQQADLGSGVLTATGPDVFVAAFTTDGVPIWSRAAGGAGDQGATGVTALSDGGFAVVARTIGDIDLGTGRLGAPADRDIVVATFDASGAARWARRYAEPGIQNVAAITADVSGALSIAGDSDAGLDFGLANPTPGAGGNDAFVLHTDPIGDPLWATMVAATPGSELIAGVATLADRSIVAVGQYGGPGLVGGAQVTNAGSSDLFIVQLASDGEAVWETTAGSDREEAAYAIAADPGGGAIAGGYFGRTCTIGAATITAVGYSDVFLLRLDQN